MTHNSVLRQLRHVLDADDEQMIAIFAAADQTVTPQQLAQWLAPDQAPGSTVLSDRDLAIFLNGLINHRRGRRAGPQPEPESQLTNNLIAIKLKIAMDLKGEDVLEMLALCDLKLSNHELSAFFRKPGHKHHRVMQDQVLRYFMRGMQRKLRPDAEEVV